MFYGLASGAIDAGDLQVEQVLADIETLNRAALEGRYEVTAVSFHAYAHLADKYALLPHGASMGDRYGPLSSPAWAVRGLSRGQGRDSRNADDRVSRAASPRTGLRVRRDALRSDPGGSGERPRRRRPVDSRGTAHLRRRRLREGRRPRRVVGRSNGWIAAATGGQHHPARPRASDDAAESRLLHDSIAHALAHREPAVAYAQQFGRGLDRSGQTRSSGCT